MPDHHNDHDQQNSQNHDDCQDCKRQRAQNDKLIAIYQKLQEVDKRTGDMKGSIILHQQQVDKQLNVLKTFDQKVQRVKNDKSEKYGTQFQEIGYNLYAQALINSKKSEAKKQNERLKDVLKKIYQDKNKLSESVQLVFQKPQHHFIAQTPPILPALSQKQSFQWFQKGNQSSRSESRGSKSFMQTSMQKSFQIFSTKSSFNMTKRKVFQKKDFEQLNLWLFEQRNQALEKELYESQQKDQFSNTDIQQSLKKGVQRYINKAKNTARLGASTVLRSSIRRQSPLLKRGYIDSFNNTKLNPQSLINKSKLESIKAVQAENMLNSSKLFNKRPVRGSVLPSISNK